jgi:hypothetical protein
MLLKILCLLFVTLENLVREPSACSLGLSATSQQYFSLTTNQPPATSQQYSSLRTNQHQPTEQAVVFGDSIRFSNPYERSLMTSYLTR